MNFVPIFMGNFDANFTMAMSSPPLCGVGTRKGRGRSSNARSPSPLGPLSHMAYAA